MVKPPWDYKYTSCLFRLHLVKEDYLLTNNETINNIENYKEFLLQDNKTDLIKEKTRTGKKAGRPKNNADCNK